MTKQQVKQLERLREAIGKKRDDIRKLVEEYEGLIDSANRGCDSLDMAEQYLNSAIDELSEEV